tara:strand:+ start:239 stop:514 length:276 start_codon:yes stop_codon:yes gene_type:complete
MTAKLMLILLGLGLTSLALLAMRQSRIDTAFEMTRLHQRCDQARTSLWDIRCNIAEHIAQEIDTLDPLEAESKDTTRLAENSTNDSDEHGG